MKPIRDNSLYLMDCKKGMKRIKPGTVDLILTDPPYIAEEWEKAYRTLAEYGERILKPSGYLITYSGHYNLPGVLDILRGAGLSYYWMMIQGNHGCKCLIHSRNVIAGFKPILIFQKPPVKPDNKIFLDVISGGRSKEYHPWEQSIQEALFIITRFGGPGDLLVDPFAGSGTSVLAAKLSGLRWIGFEINPDTHKTAAARLDQRPLDLGTFDQGVLV